jgi:malonyl-CoA/methylmalonyl-CoA synthetase
VSLIQPSCDALSAQHLPPGLAPAEVDLLADETLIGRWKRRWEERPAWRQLQTLGGVGLTSEELESRSRHDAQRFRAAGLSPGDRLVLSGPSSAELVVAYIAALRAGLTVVPVNGSYTENEVVRIVRDAHPSAAAVDSERQAGWIRSAAPEPIVLTGVDLEQLPGAESADTIDAAATEDTALLVYTSGTTGAPKGACLTHGNLLSSATAVNLAWRWEHEDVLLLVLPLFHVHGLGVGVNGSLCAGASISLRPRFDASDVAAQAARGVSMFFGVPEMYQRLASSQLCASLSKVRLLVSGSAPLPAELARSVAEACGQLPLERYGMTETVMLTSNPYAGERKPGTVGFALPGVAARLGEGGEVQVRGPNVISGYFNRPGDTRDAFTPDGWFRTGDIGELDPDGYLRLIGRSKDLIITGGLNVHPREVEEALASHPSVREVAVIGRPSDRWGEQVTAVVVPQRQIDPGELLAHAAARIAPYKVPKEVEFVAELPRNALGKILRSKLRATPPE